MKRSHSRGHGETNETTRAVLVLQQGFITVFFNVLFSGTFFGLTAPSKAADSPEIRCVETEEIDTYKVESDQQITIIMKNETRLLMRLKNRCPQLYFHRYISYTPTDGQICAGADEIRNRAGLSCRIGSFEPVNNNTDEKTGP